MGAHQLRSLIFEPSGLCDFSDPRCFVCWIGLQPTLQPPCLRRWSPAETTCTSWVCWLIDQKSPLLFWLIGFDWTVRLDDLNGLIIQFELTLIGFPWIAFHCLDLIWQGMSGFWIDWLIERATLEVIELQGFSAGDFSIEISIYDCASS